MADDDFVCKIAHPGYGCGAPEILVLGVFFLLAGMLCLVFLIRHIRSRKTSPPLGPDFNIPFWVTMAIWTVYHAIMTIFKFPWDPKYFYICGICIDAILLLLPFSFLVMIISEMLFMYRNPGNQRISFSRIVFGLFLRPDFGRRLPKFCLDACKQSFPNLAEDAFCSTLGYTLQMWRLQSRCGQPMNNRR